MGTCGTCGAGGIIGNERCPNGCKMPAPGTYGDMVLVFRGGKLVEEILRMTFSGPRNRRGAPKFVRYKGKVLGITVSDVADPRARLLPLDSSMCRFKYRLDLPEED